MTLRARALTAGFALLAALALTAHGVAFTLSDAGHVWAVNAGWTLAGVVLVVTNAAAAFRAPRGPVRAGWIQWTAVSAVWLAGVVVGDFLAWGGDTSLPTAADYLAWLFALLAGCGRPCSILHAREQKSETVRTDDFRCSGSAQRCWNPFDASVWAQPPILAPRPMYPLWPPQSIYAPRVVACQEGVQHSDLSSISGSAPGFSLLALEIA